MNELQIFDFKDKQVRTLVIDGEPWFVGKDVAEILGYQKPRNAIAAHVDEDDRKVAPIQGTLGGTQGTVIINESGLYCLVLSSKLPAAKEFKRWVTKEVLPSIRKTGMYAMDEILEDTNLMDMAINALVKLKEEKKARQALELINQDQKEQIARMEPKATYCENVLDAKNTLTTTSIAKEYGWSAQELNNILHEKGVQYKIDGMWVLYQKHADKGYTKTITNYYEGGNGYKGVNVYTRWTQKGRYFIYQTLKADGVLPLIER